MPPLEDDDRGDAADVAVGSQLARFVAVVLGNDGAAFKRFGGLFDAGSEHAAGTAPRGPEVNENGKLGLGHEFVKVGVVHVKDFAHDYSEINGTAALSGVAEKAMPGPKANSG